MTASASLPEPESRFRRYLLGALPEADADAVEAEALGDAATFDALRVAEDELIEGYARGELDPAEVIAFEARLRVVPGWPQKVTLARALAARADRHAGVVAVGAEPAAARASDPAPESLLARVRAWLFPARGVPGWALAAAMVALLAVGAALLAREGGGARVGGGSYAVSLRPDALRGPGAVMTLALPEGAETVAVALELELPGEAPSYRVTVSTRGDARHVARDLHPDGAGVLHVDVPARLLAPGTYELAVAADATGEPIAFYTLTITAAP